MGSNPLGATKWRVVRVVIWSSAKALTQVRILYSPLDIVGRLGNPFGLISQIFRFDSWPRNNMVFEALR